MQAGVMLLDDGAPAKERSAGMAPGRLPGQGKPLFQVVLARSSSKLTVTGGMNVGEASGQVFGATKHRRDEAGRCRRLRKRTS